MAKVAASGLFILLGILAFALFSSIILAFVTDNIFIVGIVVLLIVFFNVMRRK